MKVAILSDLHNDTNRIPYLFENCEDEIKDVDVFIFSGDIAGNDDGYKSWVSKFGRIIKEHNKKDFDILSIHGNHDYYRNKFEDLYNWYFEKLGGEDPQTKKKTQPLKSDKVILIRDGVFFIGTTLWSPPQTDECFKYINDYYYINYFDENYGGNVKNVFKLYKREKKWLISNIEKYKKLYPDHKIVVFTHHLPIKGLSSINNSCSSAFSNILKEDNDEYLNLPVDIWICGHIHEKIRKKVKGIEFIVNPRGYEREKTYKDYKPLIIEI